MSHPTFHPEQAPSPRPGSRALSVAVRAITLDLDDTLWPIMPTIARAEAALQAWLQRHAPATAAQAADGQALLAARRRVQHERPELAHDLSALRRESIRHVLRAAGDDPAWAEPAFEVFFEARQQVVLFDDARPALERLAARWPLVAVTNGNADLRRVGLDGFFQDVVSARVLGVGKPDARIFHAATDRLGRAPAEVLHIGDDAELDGVGALGAGLSMAWVNRTAQTWPHPERPPHLHVGDLCALCDALGA